MSRYQFELDGRGRDGDRFATRGELDAGPGEFPTVCTRAIERSFQHLTEGTAFYGDLRTCRGPYTIERLVIRLVEEWES